MGGSAVRLPRQIPYTVAMDLLLTGRAIKAPEAKEIGLIGHVVPDGEALAKAHEIADLICANGPLAVQAILKTVRDSEGKHEEDCWADDAVVGMAVFASEDAKEGPRAFAEKRAAAVPGSLASAPPATLSWRVRLERLAALVVVELVDLDLLRAAVGVVRREHRRRRAGHVHQGDRQQRRRGGEPGRAPRRRSRTASRTPARPGRGARRGSGPAPGTARSGRPTPPAGSRTGTARRHSTAATEEGARAATEVAIPPPWLPPATATRAGSTRSWPRSTSSAATASAYTRR